MCGGDRCAAAASHVCLRGRCERESDMWHTSRTPSKLGWLQSLGDEAVHRPRVDELIHGLGQHGLLRIALCLGVTHDLHLPSVTAYLQCGCP